MKSFAVRRREVTCESAIIRSDLKTEETLLDGTGTYYSTVSGPASVYPGTAKFIKDFKAKFNADPQPFAAQGYDLREIVRKNDSDTDLTSAIGHIWQGRADRYSELRSELAPDAGAGIRRVEMSYIGG